MKDALILEHKKYISAKRAAEITGYTSDYVGQLCRSGKIISKVLGRGWFVLEESLLEHKLINDQVKTNKKTAKKRKAFLAREFRAEIREEKLAEEINSLTTALLLTERAESLMPKTSLVAVVSPIVPSLAVISSVQVPSVKSSPIVSPIKYESAASPLLPLLKKQIQNDEARRSGQEVKVKFVPAHFSMRGVEGKSSCFVPLSSFLSDSFVSNSKNSLAPIKSPALVLSRFQNSSSPINIFATALIIVMIAGSGLFIRSSIMALNNWGEGSSQLAAQSASQSASLASVSNNIIQSIIHALENVSDRIAMLFGGNHLHLAEAPLSPPPDSQVSNRDLGFDGIAVVPSSNSPEKDELIKQRIKDSFSDEVQVHPDETKTSGVITPVFRKATKDNFVYVLVPIQNQSSE